MSAPKTWKELCDHYVFCCVMGMVRSENLLDARDGSTQPQQKLFGLLRDEINAGRSISTSDLLIKLQKDSSYEMLSSALDDANLAYYGGEVKTLVTRVREYAKNDRARWVMPALAEASALADTKKMAEIVSKLAEILSGNEGEAEVYTAREAMALGLETAQRESKEAGGIKTGWPTLDAIYRVTPGSLLTIGADTNVGKSTVIVSWLWTMAQHGTPVGIVSVEDPVEDFGIKVLAAASATDPSHLWQMSMSKEEASRVSVAVQNSKIPFFYTWARSRELQTVLDRMDYLANVCGCKVVAVDFLQAVNSPAAPSKRESIDKVIEMLIAKAGKLNVGLILASQLSRRPEDADGNRGAPSITSLKESGTIENRSQCVVLLHRKGPTDPEIKVRLAKVKRHAAGAEFVVARQNGNGLLYEVGETKGTSPW